MSGWGSSGLEAFSYVCAGLLVPALAATVFVAAMTATATIRARG
ncbi:hypothetical protein OG735_37365 [Streptomyces sp. NBC_01210]|nr:hypothetical protein OG735_37365 [Streptomyces sp. NBC_01210]